MRTFRSAVAVAASVLGLAVVGALAVSPPAAASAGHGGRLLYNYSEETPSGGFETNVRTVMPAGTWMHELTKDRGEKFAGGFFPNGEQVAYVDGGAVGTLWLMRSDGSERHPLGASRLTGSCPQVSPDGQRIAYRGGEFGEIWIVNRDGSGAHRISGSDTNLDQCPAWSPDSRRLAFVRFVSFADPDVWVINADGTGAQRLTTDGEIKSTVSWSPDGRKLAYDRGGDIWLMHTNGQFQRPVTVTPVIETSPVWAPDGARIAYGRYENGNFQVWVMHTHGEYQRSVGVTGTPAGWRNY
jgi:TolB protein